MKFIHLADCHLSTRNTYDDNKGNFINKITWKSFENIFTSNKDADFALICGDLFERDYFSQKDYKYLFNIFENFSKDIYYVTGNHDYIDQTNEIFLKAKPSNFHIFMNDNLSFYENDGIRIYGLSYKDRIYDKDFPYELKLDKSFYNILMAHGNLSNTKSSYLDLDFNKLNALGYDYIGLGHIHKSFIKSNIYNPGSIEPFDFTDLGDFGYFLNVNGKVDHITSNFMKYNIFDISAEQFKDEEEIIRFVNENLSDKINFLRLTFNKADDFDISIIKNSINSHYIEIIFTKENTFENEIKLFPNSLLSKFADKFDRPLNEIEKKAYQIGMDAILRSKKWVFL